MSSFLNNLGVAQPQPFFFGGSGGLSRFAKLPKRYLVCYMLLYAIIFAHEL